MPHDKTAQTAPAAKGAAKLKMSNTKFKVLLIIPMVIVALVAILATMAGVTLGSTLDTFLGKGETYVETPNDKTAWDSSYYNVQVTEGEEYPCERQRSPGGSFLVPPVELPPVPWPPRPLAAALAQPPI